MCRFSESNRQKLGNVEDREYYEETLEIRESANQMRMALLERPILGFHTPYPVVFSLGSAAYSSLRVLRTW